jgi:hypothetical protein
MVAKGDQMERCRSFVVIGCTLVVMLVLSAVIHAHPMMYQGTVLAVEPTRVQVRIVDVKNKGEDRSWFAVGKNTKVKRGEKNMSYAEAKIAAGERIVVIVDMDAETKNLAEEIRLAAK